MYILTSQIAYTLIGWEFIGWSIAPIGPVVYIDRANVLTLTRDEVFNLFAQWEAIYCSVTYMPNIPADGVYTGNGSMPKSDLFYDTPSKLRSNTWLVGGYQFLGWASTSSGQIIYLDEQEVINLTDEYVQTIRLYAIWGSRSYQITLKLNGGTIGSNPINKTVSYNTSYTLPVPSKNGLVFLGWYIMEISALKQTDDSGVSIVNYLFTKDMTFEALWSEIHYFVHFKKLSDSASGSDLRQIELSFTDNVPFATVQFYRIGYDLIGWRIGLSNVILPVMTYMTGLSANEGDIIEVTAVWQAYTYTIKYHDQNNQDASLQEIKYTFDLETSVLTYPTNPTGYIFKGWSRTPQGQVSFTPNQYNQNQEDNS